MNRFPEGSSLSNRGVSAVLAKNAKHALFRNLKGASGIAKSIDEASPVLVAILIQTERQNLMNPDHVDRIVESHRS